MTRWLSGSLVPILAATLAAQGSPQASPDSGMDANAWLEKGTAQQRANDPGSAAASFRKARELGLGSITLLIRGSLALAASGDRDTALEWIEAAVKSGARTGYFKSIDALGDLREDPRFLSLENKYEHPCAKGPHLQFDFWLGEWNVFNPQGSQVGQSRIEKITDGCVVHENWTSSASGVGKSYNFYDKRSGRWRQVWVDDSARVMDFAGEFRDGAMRFEGKTTDASGKVVDQRMTFTPLASGDVRQHIEQSSDGGKTYSTWFDGTYKRR
ncbi:MAG: hypothetical protein R2762_18055 [Bryobacteraceae bacterium]